MREHMEYTLCRGKSRTIPDRTERLSAWDDPYKALALTQPMFSERSLSLGVAEHFQFAELPSVLPHAAQSNLIREQLLGLFGPRRDALIINRQNMSYI